jgi:hypothetical protein
MMRYRMLPLLIGMALSGLAATRPADPASAANAMEKRALFGGETAKEWATAECTVEASPERVKATPAALRWSIPVDHTTGEPKYPVGWPRFGRAIPEGPLRDWSGWDYLHFWVYTETSRDALPRDPAGLGLHVPDRERRWSRSLGELKKGEWVEIKIPLSQIPDHHDVRYIQFNIAESNYHHGDRIDFYIDDLALLRYARPTLLEFTAESGVVFAGTRQLPVRFRMAGVKPSETAAVTCELRGNRGIVARATAKVDHGAQRVVLDLGTKGLAPGTYVLSARTPDGAPVTARVRVVESPWR